MTMGSQRHADTWSVSVVVKTAGPTLTKALTTGMGLMGAAGAASTAADVLSTPGKPKKPKTAVAGVIGSPMSRVASDLREMAAVALPAPLTTETASSKLDTKPVAPVADTQNIKSSAVKSIADDDRGRHSTQLGSGRAMTVDSIPKPKPVVQVTKPEAIEKSALAVLRPAWRVIRDVANRAGKWLQTGAPYAGHVVTYGGAALTAKGLYDMIRAEQDRKVQLEEQKKVQNEQEQREREFHDARMGLVRSADPLALPPMSVERATYAPGEPAIQPTIDHTTILPTDARKTGSFDPRLPPPPPALVKPKPKGPSLVDQIGAAIDPALSNAFKPHGIDFAHSAEPVIRV